MVQTLIKPKKVKQRTKTDIVFCIDISGSMGSCINGVKNNIEEFVDRVQGDTDVIIDWRLGIIGHDAWDNVFFKRLNFTNNTSVFKRVLQKLETGSNEANLQALDWSLDFPWRNDAHKFVIFFTDESVDGGWQPALSRSKLDELMNKIQDLGVSVHIISFSGPDFQDYRKISTIDKCHYIEINEYNDFNGVGFDKLMEKLGKSVSSGSRGIVSKQKIVKKNIYNIDPEIKDLQ